MKSEAFSGASVFGLLCVGAVALAAVVGASGACANQPAPKIGRGDASSSTRALQSPPPSRPLQQPTSRAPQPAGSPAGRPAPPTPASTRPRTQEACKACRGEWATHGLADRASCNCRTSDSGKHCRDKNECEGECVLGDKLETEVTTPGPPPRGYFVGRCSDFITVFGCYRFLERGTKAQGPVLLDGPPPDTMCVD